jgi:hypothetical protein
MSTRAIVTSQPDVACYVCERRLLRGEQPEIFLVDGAPQTVCELCAPRAAHQGWPRGGEAQARIQPVVRSRRAGGLLGRLRDAALPAGRRPGLAAQPAGGQGEDGRGPAAEELLGAGDGGATPAGMGRSRGEQGAASHPGPLELALEAFNRGEYPRRIASLARSLGAPEVSAQLDEDLGVATIVVAWELCWYRYRVDVDEQPPEASMISQGDTLGELGRDERVGNALADEQGALSLIAAPV